MNNKNLISVMPSNNDQFDPVILIRDFNKQCKDAISRYNGNNECITIRDQDTQDILHEIELSEGKSASEGYKLYRKLKIVREDRRRAKAENEILEPFIQWLQQNQRTCEQLAQVQGKCSTKQQVIAKRRYTPRGDILSK